MIDGRHRSVSRACRETGWPIDTYKAALQSSDVVKIRREQWEQERAVVGAQIREKLVRMVDTQLAIAQSPERGQTATKAFQVLMQVLDKYMDADQHQLEDEVHTGDRESPALLIARRMIEKEQQREQDLKITIESTAPDPAKAAIDVTPQ